MKSSPKAQNLLFTNMGFFSSTNDKVITPHCLFFTRSSQMPPVLAQHVWNHRFRSTTSHMCEGRNIAVICLQRIYTYGGEWNSDAICVEKKQFSKMNSYWIFLLFKHFDFDFSWYRFAFYMRLINTTCIPL